MRFLKAAKLRSADFSVLVVALALGLGQVSVAREMREMREVKDATSTRIKLVAHPRRIVTLAPSLGELAADLLTSAEGDHSDRIVGVSEYTDYPPKLEKVSSIGPYSKFNLEKVVGLKPDLVLATQDGNSKDQVMHLRELGVPVVVVSTQSLAEVEESIRLVGQATGEEKAAAAMLEKFRSGLEKIRQRISERLKKTPRRSVLLQVGDSPLIVVGRKSFLNEAIETVGGRNAYSDSDNGYPRPAIEDVIRRDPESIVVLALGKDLKPFQMMAQAWARFSKLSAVKNGRVKVLQGDPILRPTLRLLQGLNLLEQAIYPEGSK